MPQNQLLLSRARAAVIARDFALAVRLYKQLLRDDKDNVQLLNQLGNLYIKAGKDEMALPVFKRISELDGENCDPLITMGGIYRRLKRYEESIATLEQALVLDGDNPQISYNLGFTYKIMGDTENAISCFEDAVEMNPDDVLAYNHLGAIYASRGEYEKAVQSYQRGLNVDANHPVLLLNLAKSYEALGEFEKACAAYSGALRSKPLWNDAIDGYSRLLIELNRVREAYNLVNRAISVNPKDKNLIEAFENIKRHIKDNNITFEDEAVAENPEDEAAEAVADIPEDFPLPKVDNSEFDADGLEIQMEDKDEFAEIEDRSLEPSVEEIAAGAEEGPADEEDYSSPFDFDSMGMDDLAGDGPLDPLVFNKADEEPLEEEAEQQLDDLIKNDEAPVDSEDVPVTDSGIFDDFEDDALFNSPSEEEEDITPVQDGAEPFYEEDFNESSPSPAADETPVQKASSDDIDELKKLTEDLKEQVEEAKDTLDRANRAAEKARDAAELAADSARSIEDALPEEEPPAEEDFIPQAEDETAIDEQPADEAAEAEDGELPAEEETAEEEIPEPVFPDESDEAETVDIEDFGDDFGFENNAEEEDPRLSLFKKLRELLEYLPEDKKEEFETSEIRLKMDYVIARLSGEKGLFEKASELILSGSVKPFEGTQDEGENVLESGLAVLKNLTALVSDRNLKQAMQEMLKKTAGE